MGIGLKRKLYLISLPSEERTQALEKIEKKSDERRKESELEKEMQMQNFLGLFTSWQIVIEEFLNKYRVSPIESSLCKSLVIELEEAQETAMSLLVDNKDFTQYNLIEDIVTIYDAIQKNWEEANSFENPLLKATLGSLILDFANAGCKTAIRTLRNMVHIGFFGDELNLSTSNNEEFIQSFQLYIQKSLTNIQNTLPSYKGVQLPYDEMCLLYKKGDIELIVDKIAATHTVDRDHRIKGSDRTQYKSSSCVFPLLVVISFILFFYIKWYYALAVLAFAVACCFETQKTAGRMVIKNSLENEQLYNDLIRQRVIWIQYKGQ